MSFRLLFDILVIYVALQQKMHRGTLQAEQRAGPNDPNVIFKGTEEWPLCSRCVPKSQDIWGFLQEAGSILTLGKCKKCLLSWLEEVHLFCTCCQILPAVFQYVAEVKPLCYPKMFSGLNVLTQLLSSGKSWAAFKSYAALALSGQDVERTVSNMKILMTATPRYFKI